MTAQTPEMQNTVTMTKSDRIVGTQMHNFITKWLRGEDYNEMWEDLDFLVQGSIRGSEEGTNHFSPPL